MIVLHTHSTYNLWFSYGSYYSFRFSFELNQLKMYVNTYGIDVDAINEWINRPEMCDAFSVIIFICLSSLCFENCLRSWVKKSPFSNILDQLLSFLDCIWWSLGLCWLLSYMMNEPLRHSIELILRTRKGCSSIELFFQTYKFIPLFITMRLFLIGSAQPKVETCKNQSYFYWKSSKPHHNIRFSIAEITSARSHLILSSFEFIRLHVRKSQRSKNPNNSFVLTCISKGFDTSPQVPNENTLHVIQHESQVN